MYLERKRQASTETSCTCTTALIQTVPRSVPSWDLCWTNSRTNCTEKALPAFSDLSNI